MNYTYLSIYRLKLKYIFKDPEKVANLFIGLVVLLLLICLIYYGKQTVCR
jgi:hypothetical protein